MGLGTQGREQRRLRYSSVSLCPTETGGPRSLGALVGGFGQGARHEGPVVRLEIGPCDNPEVRRVRVPTEKSEVTDHMTYMGRKYTLLYFPCDPMPS